MVCPRCGAEHEIDVLDCERSKTANGDYSTKVDCREVKCKNCDFLWKEESRIAVMSVYNPTTKRKKWVKLDEYNSVWRARDEFHPKKLRLFDFGAMDNDG